MRRIKASRKAIRGLIDSRNCWSHYIKKFQPRRDYADVIDYCLSMSGVY
jgi:hypothetical protein